MKLDLHWTPIKKPSIKIHIEWHMYLAKAIWDFYVIFVKTPPFHQF